MSTSKEVSSFGDTEMEMTCLYCDYNFTNPSHFNGHVCKDSNRGSDSNDPAISSSEKAYTLHLEERSTPSGDESELEVNCLFCDRTFSSATQLRDHSCTFQVTPTTEMPHHSFTSHRDEEGAYPPQEYEVSCLYCGKSFSSQDQLNNHVCSSESQLRDVNQNLDNVTSPDGTSDRGVDSAQFDISCLYCAKTFPGQSQLNRHMCPVKNRSPPQPVYQSRFLYTERRSEDDQELVVEVTCLYCHEKFTYPDQLSVHRCTLNEGNSPELTDQQQSDERLSAYDPDLRDHDYGGDKWQVSLDRENRPHQCTICHKTFKHVGGLKSHQDVHSDKQYSCPHCNRTFRNSGPLIQHATKMHEKDVADSIRKIFWPYACSTCDKRFKELVELNNHEKLHLGLKQFGCAHCGRGFTTSFRLSIHLREHTGENSYTCSFCAKKYSSKCALKTHAKTHTGEKPFKCTICDKRFSQKKSKDDHEQKHTEDNPFKCTQCDLSFRTARGLRSHQGHAHLPEQLFKCSFCEQTFTRSTHRNAHESTHLGQQTTDTDQMAAANGEDENGLRSEIKMEMMALEDSPDKDVESSQSPSDGKFGDFQDFLREISSEPV